MAIADESILTSTKKILGIAEDYTAFDLDVITHINASFSTLNQLGVGPAEGFIIEDKEAKWSDLQLLVGQLSMSRTYIFLKTKLVFDPPATSFTIDAMDKQIAQLEWRLNVARENAEEVAT